MAPSSHSAGPRATGSRPPRTGLLRRLDVQVAVGVLVGAAIGGLFPHFGASLGPVGDAFIRLIRMLLAPVILGTVVVGIARMDNLKELGRIGLKALLYFEVVSSFALLIGLAWANLFQPGAGMNIDPKALDTSPLAAYTNHAAQAGGGSAQFFLNLVPTSLFDALARNDMLQIIVFAVLLGIAMARHPGRTQPFLTAIESALHALFGVVDIVMRFAPVGAAGAMAFTVGRFGIHSLIPLARLVLGVYGCSLLFVAVVLTLIARICGFSLWRFLRYIREELVVVFATASTESVLPRMLEKLEALGCRKAVVGVVLPAGYTFNPDGTAIYLTMASIFVAQATNTPLTLGDQLVVLGVLLLTSKGSAGVAGAGFITLAATLASVGKIPVAGLVLLLGVDRILNVARAVTNLIGNGVATVAIARWEKALDRPRLERILASGTSTPAD